MAFLIVDCNNFYVACERAFDASLVGRPVVVLSNNDGCIISRSREAKAVGIPMGAPAFQCRHAFAAHNVAVLSSNYALYGDMSQRVMETLARFTDDLETYSIDEAFLRLDAPAQGETAASWQGAVRLAGEIRQTVRRWTGITVSVGVASTRTLAKLANHRAKADPAQRGVFCFDTAPFPEQLLAATEVEEVWGIGRRRGEALRQHGITTALALRQASPAWVRRRFTVTGHRTQMELRGIPCISLETATTRQSITCSRSFGRPVTALAELREAVTCFVERAAEKLRGQGSAARVVHVYLRASRGGADDPPPPPYGGRGGAAAAGTATLDMASAYTPDLVAAAHRVLESLYAPGGPSYSKAGVLLCDLCPEGKAQLSLFAPTADPVERERRGRLMESVDGLNRRFGRGTVFLAASGIERGWQGRQARRSPRYTTSWRELFAVS